MNRHIAHCLLLVTVATGCYRPEDYLLNPSRADRVLSVTLSATTIAADGISRVTITAQLDPRSDADKRNVTFTTTVGTLVADGKEGLSITVPADSTGKAVVELRSSTTPATARLEITVASVSRTALVTFLLLAREEAFDASVSRTSVPADGFSTTVITVTLKRLGTVLQRAVKFETSLGTLIATGQASSRVVTVTADATGRAVVELQSEKTIGTAHVRVTALEIPHEFDIAFTQVDPAQIITVSASPSSGPADGVTPLIVSAIVAASLPAGRRSVTFRSTIGQLLPVIIEADGRQRRACQPGQHHDRSGARHGDGRWHDRRHNGAVHDIAAGQAARLAGFGGAEVGWEYHDCGHAHSDNGERQSPFAGVLLSQDRHRRGHRFLQSRHSRRELGRHSDLQRRNDHVPWSGHHHGLR